MPKRHLSSWFFTGLLALVGGCDKKAPDPASASSEGPGSAAETTMTTAPDAGGSPDEAGVVERGGMIVVDGTHAVEALVLEPYIGVGGEAPPRPVKPDKSGRVKAGIYKVPDRTCIAVPEGGTVHVRADENRGVMIGGLSFQLDPE